MFHCHSFVHFNQYLHFLPLNITKTPVRGDLVVRRMERYGLLWPAPPAKARAACEWRHEAGPRPRVISGGRGERRMLNPRE
jgi:hypothetical protein